MARLLPDWMAAYLEYTSDQESPEILHYWTGYSVLSAAIRRQVFLDRDWYDLYPNLYVLVIAESGRLRKSVAINMGLDLLRRAVPDCTVMVGRMTPEGLVRSLNIAKHERKHDGSVLRKNPATVMIHADELATLFGYDRQTASRMAILLTELYGCPNTYTHTTARDGVVDIHQVYVSMLAATAPQNFKVMPEETVGGLLGRLIIVSARDKRKPIAWATPSEHRERLGEHLVSDLYEISQMKGPIKISQEAKDLFTEWYNRQQAIEFNDARLDALHERCHDTALKIAILTSLSRSDENLILESHIQHGITTIEKLLPAYARIMEWTSNTLFGQNRVKFLDVLRRSKGRVERREALRIMSLPLEEFDQLVRTLQEEGTIKRIAPRGRGDEAYELVQKG